MSKQAAPLARGIRWSAGGKLGGLAELHGVILSHGRGGTDCKAMGANLGLIVTHKGTHAHACAPTPSARRQNRLATA